MNIHSEPDLARAASWFADRSRVAMMAALSNGQALPAGELARAAEIGAAAASEHLSKLLEAGLVEVVAQGRHRYYRLANDGIGELLERLAVLAPQSKPLTAGQTRASAELKFARTCYGHLAGVVGVAVTRALFGAGILREIGAAALVTELGISWFADHGVDVDALEGMPAVRLCPVDWSERRPHLAGALGKRLTTEVLARGYFVRVRGSRALQITGRGRRWLYDGLDIDLNLARD